MSNKRPQAQLYPPGYANVGLVLIAMNFVRQKGPRVIIKQVPILLLLATVFLSLPWLAFSLFHIFTWTDADGTIFCFFFGSGLLWVFLEFVATRERFEIDDIKKLLTRRVSGVFFHKEQAVDLNDIKGIGLEIKMVVSGTKRRRLQYLYMYGSKEKFLLNNPSKLYLDQTKLGRLLSKFTGIPFDEQAEATES